MNTKTHHLGYMTMKGTIKFMQVTRDHVELKHDRDMYSHEQGNLIHKHTTKHVLIR